MTIKNRVTCYGPPTLIARVRWAPSSAAVQTLTESVGVASVSRTSAGLYVINLLPGMKSLFARASHIYTDTTNFHWTEPTVSSVSAGTVTVRHRTQAFASVTSAPSASDTVDQLLVSVWGRVAA